jgi:hypothetical protein
MERALLTLLLIISAPAVVGMFAAALQVPVWIAAIALLPAYAVLVEFIQL